MKRPLVYPPDALRWRIGPGFAAHCRTPDGTANSIQAIRVRLLAVTLPFSQERRERMALLRQIDHQLIDPAAPNYKRLVENLVLKVEKDRERIKDFIRALSDPTNPVTDNKRRRQRENSIDRILLRNIEAVRSARLDLMRAPGVGVVEGYKLGHQLKAYERELLKIQRQFSFGAERAAAPGTAAEVAKERAAAAILSRAERTANKLESLGAWYQPSPGSNGRKRPFDPFAKRQALTRIATHLSDTLSAAQITPDSAITQRVTALRPTLIDTPAPEPRRVLGAMDAVLQDVRVRVDYDVRHAAHIRTPEKERATLRQASHERLDATANRLRDARRELGELPGLTGRERTEQAARLKRLQRVFVQAGRQVDNPIKLSATLAGLDRLRDVAPSPETHLRRHINGPDLIAGPAGYSLRDPPAIPFRQPELYAIPHREGAPATTLDSLRTLSGVDLDGAAQRSAVLLPDHARDRVEDKETARAGELRRPDDGLGAGSSGARQGSSGERLAPRAAPGDRLTAEQLADLLQLVHARLIDARAWDDPTPFRSGQREFYEGSKQAPAVELDAFAKRRAMFKEIDGLKPEIDAAHVNFTPEMRRTLGVIRNVRDALNSPTRDIDRLVNQLAKKITNDQLAIERRSDRSAATATEALQRRRAADRAVTRNLQSIEDAKREVQRSPNLKPMERISMAARLKSMAQALGAYSGKGLGKE